MKKITMLLLMLILCGIRVHAQQEKGIHFEQKFSWDNIIAKAKAEHKYIFVDCYASWCAPCKWMDSNVYNQPRVAEVYVKNFICVKLRMDHSSDNDNPQNNPFWTANMIAKDYLVNEYPTLIFFGPDGKVVHKVIGSMDAKHFISLSDDARNPAKQYYGILQNFQKGKIDTTDEKGLILAFGRTELASKLVEDYLSRVPEAQLGSSSNLYLIGLFKENPGLLAIGIGYLQKLSKEQLMKKPSLGLVIGLSEQSEVRKLILAYFEGLNDDQRSSSDNLNLISQFNTDTAIQRIAKNYINQLPEDSLYSPKIIGFIRHFDQSTNDRAFDVFYNHEARVDNVMREKGYAHARIAAFISNAELSPFINVANANDMEPDWVAFQNRVASKFNKNFAEEMIINGKVSWANSQFNKKNDEQHRSNLIRAKIAQIEWFRWDTIGGASGIVNDFVYSHLFLHSDNKKYLNTGVNWMKEIITNNPADYESTDTYACILYKTGKKNEAIQLEHKALQLAIAKNDKSDIAAITTNEQKMKSGEKFWLEKEYQESN